MANKGTDSCNALELHVLLGFSGELYLPGSHTQNYLKKQILQLKY